MVNKQSGIKFFVIATTIFLAVFPWNVESVGEEDGSWLDVAQNLLQESVRNQNDGSGANVLGGLVQGLMQSEGGRQLGHMLTKKNGGGAVDLIANLASLWQSSKFNSNGKGLKQESSIDPAIVGSMIDLFSTLNKVSNDAENNNVDENNNDKHAEPKSQEEPSMDWDAILSFAGTMISSMSDSNKKESDASSSGGLESFLSFLPVLMNSLTGNHNVHSSHSIPHHTHSQFLPPFLENLHEYWDYFLTTDFGKTLWENSGLSDLVKSFSSSDGQIQTKKIVESLKNNTFRRKWIKSVASFVAQWVKHFTDPKVQKSYLETAQVICNSFLQSYGYPKESFIDFNQPAKSISALTNNVFKKQFNLKINSENYVTPVVLYIQELFKTGSKTRMGFLKVPTEDIESRVSATLENEVIDPILRVHRAFEFAQNRRECAKYVICFVNRSKDSARTGLKPGITKLLSLAASWSLSGYESHSFWDFYDVAVEEQACQKYDKNCSGFDEEDMKATTEYYHNEL